MLLRVFIIAACICKSSSWQHWEYSSFATDDWRDTWGFENGPRGRQGHSMVVWNHSKVIMFGGRDNEIHRPHIPRNYDLTEDEGVFHFDSYSDKPLLTEKYDSTCSPVMECTNLIDAASGNNESCSYSWQYVLDDVMNGNGNDRLNKEESCGFAVSALLYNDIWVYDLDCRRFGDLPCENDGWRVLHPGKNYGGCRDDESGERICEIPSERWGHGAAMIDSKTMVVYGGYSQECEDYCDDVWTFDFDALHWERIMVASPPGKRWKFSMVSTEGSGNKARVVVFGGHRLWHGFANDNLQENRWSSNRTFPEGGYLDDLWALSKIKSENPEGSENSTEWVWTQLQPKQSCIPDPGIAWEDRNNARCEIHWPTRRSGHAVAFDNERNRMWVHGGYATHYPYPSSTSSGAGPGVKELRDKGVIPYASHSYFLNDLWFYDFESEVWTEVFPADSARPTMRTDHLMVKSRDLLILNGGFAHNHYFNDTWYYNITETRWLKKESFVHADCTDDVAVVEGDSECVELDFPRPLIRTNEVSLGVSYQQLLPFSQQPGYTPDFDQPLYFGIVDDAEVFVASLQEMYLSNITMDEKGNIKWLKSDIPDGTPIAPAAANAPRQYAKMRNIEYNHTLTLEIWEWCISTKSEPTRGTIIDSKFGRANHTIYIPQSRRQAVGWDGCRELRWIYPPSRSAHRGVFVEKYGKMIVYGGLSYSGADRVSGAHPLTGLLNVTHETHVVEDMWTYGIDICPNNCSSFGVCTNGFCKCDPGHYGLDCSKINCPGNVCVYDEDNTQHCKHCCYDGFTHNMEEDKYISGVGKVPCKPHEGGGGFTGNSNGVCDGFGTCQCAPPFVGEDCSIKDCANDCSGNGYCSLEFPVARCICKNGYKGDSCQHIECLNNCSYPNGLCTRDTGICSCSPIYSPHNESRILNYWQGEDCSLFLSSASVNCCSIFVTLWITLIITVIIVVM